jgi:hypothetical protein
MQATIHEYGFIQNPDGLWWRRPLECYKCRQTRPVCKCERCDCPAGKKGVSLLCKTCHSISSKYAELPPPSEPLREIPSELVWLLDTLGATVGYSPAIPDTMIGPSGLPDGVVIWEGEYNDPARQQRSVGRIDPARQQRSVGRIWINRSDSSSPRLLTLIHEICHGIVARHFDPARLQLPNYGLGEVGGVDCKTTPLAVSAKQADWEESLTCTLAATVSYVLCRDGRFPHSYICEVEYVNTDADANFDDETFDELVAMKLIVIDSEGEPQLCF